MVCEWSDKIFSVTEADFEALALKIFRFQYANNSIYNSFVDALQIKPEQVNSVTKIPFLPISFFKSHKVVSSEFEPEAIFESSGTTQLVKSKHFVKSVNLYSQSFLLGFEKFYGPITNYCILGLLPSYLEQKNSSLVFMVNELIQKSKHSQSGFYLNEFDLLAKTLIQLEEAMQKTLLIGVTFALLDFAKEYSIPLKHTIVMETGGMKGRQEEITRQEVHHRLKKSFQSETIHIEYGMTELLSQAYSQGNGIFKTPPWIQLFLREKEDPLTIQKRELGKPRTGAINSIDLANVYSCSFIATDDLGKIYDDDSFEILGRLDESDVRGCSQLVIY